jgi:hypothetical protein
MERLSVTVQGRDWPATLGDFTLVGPADNQGAWRWYERHHDGSIERIKVDHQLQPIKPMSTNFSITPSAELVASLRNSAPHGIRDAGVTRELWLINHAYTAGADQRGTVNEAELQKARDEELKACLWHLESTRCNQIVITTLRAARRPKPPSDKELALNALSLIMSQQKGMFDGKPFNTIRRVLEALPND